MGGRNEVVIKELSLESELLENNCIQEIIWYKLELSPRLLEKNTVREHWSGITQGQRILRNNWCMSDEKSHLDVMAKDGWKKDEGGK